MICESLQWSTLLEWEYLSRSSSISSSQDILSGYFQEGLLTGPTLDNKSMTVVWTSVMSCFKLSRQAWLPRRWAILETIRTVSPTRIFAHKISLDPKPLKLTQFQNLFFYRWSCNSRCQVLSISSMKMILDLMWERSYWPMAKKSKYKLINIFRRLPL